MKTFASIVALLGLGLFAAGCSPEDRLEQAQEGYMEERQETAETARDAQIGGMTAEDQQDVAEEQAEDLEAAGDVIQREGELLQDRVD